MILRRLPYSEIRFAESRFPDFPKNAVRKTKIKILITWSIFIQIKKTTPQNRKSWRAQQIGQGPKWEKVHFWSQMQFVRQKIFFQVIFGEGLDNFLTFILYSRGSKNSENGRKFAKKPTNIWWIFSYYQHFIISILLCKS